MGHIARLGRGGLVTVSLTGLTVAVACSPAGSGSPAIGVDASQGSSTSTAQNIDAAASPFDGTVGSPCQTDAMCRGAHGPGVNRCSNDAFQTGPLLPTPVCVLPSCDPGKDGKVHGCDGPDSLGSPGVCYDLGAGQGICLPACTFPTDGSAPRGCIGKNVCNFYGQGTNPATGEPYGIGYCLGGCATDADCPQGSACETNSGFCQTKATPPTLSLGSTCNASSQDPGCNCFGNPTTGAGYCVQFCVTGSTTIACPSGYVCDSTEPSAFVSSEGGASGFATQTPGLAGFCLAACDPADDAGISDGASSESEADGLSDASGDANASDGLDDATDDGTPMDATSSFDADLDSPLSSDSNDEVRKQRKLCPAAATCSDRGVAGWDCLP